MKRGHTIAFSTLFVAILAACQSAPASTETASLAPAAEVAVSQEAVPEATEGVKVASADADTICRSVKVTGTRFAKRECKTADAWEKFDAITNQNAREATDKIQRLTTGSSMGGT